MALQKRGYGLNTSDQHHLSLLGILLVACFSAAVVVFGAFFTYNTVTYEGRYTPDSIIYIDASRNLTEGRGLSRSMVEVHRLVDRDAELPLPLTQWGPVYPILIAAVSLTPLDEPQAAFLVSCIFLLILVAAAVLLFVRLYDLPTATFAGVWFLFFPPLLAAASHAWSETIGLSFAMLALGLGIHYARSESGSIWLAFAIGAFAGLAIATRYAFLPLLLLLPLLLRDRHSLWRTLGRVGGLALGTAMFLAPVFARNYANSGTIGGAAPGTAESNLMQGLVDMGLAVAYSFQFEDVFALYMVLAVCAVALIAVVFRMRRGELKPILKETLFENGRWVLLVWPVLYAAFLLVAQSIVYIDPLSPRLLLPATLVVFALGMILVHRLVRPWPDVTAAVCLALAVAAIVPQAKNAELVSDPRITHPYDIAKNIDRSAALSWLQENLSEDDLLIAEEGLDIPYYLGPIDTAFFSQSRTPNRPLQYEPLTQWLLAHNRYERYGRVVLLLRPKTGDPEQVRATFGPFVADLLERRLQEYPGVHFVARVDDGVLFEIRCSELLQG